MIARQAPTLMIEEDDGYEQLRHKYKSITIIDPQDPTGAPYCSEITKLYLLSRLNIDKFGHLTWPCQVDFSAFIQAHPGRFRKYFMSMRSQKVQALVQEAKNQDSIERFYGMAELEIRYHMEEMREMHRQQVNRNKKTGESFEFEADFVACPFAQAVFAFQSECLAWLLDGYTPNVYKLTHKPSKNCQCGLPRTVENALGDLVCGSCFIGRVRKEGDCPFVPNTFHQMRVNGLHFNQEQLARWRQMHSMPTLKEENNIASMVQNRFIFDSHLTWRGDLAGHILLTDIAIINENQVPAVIHALNNQRFLALSIREIDWLEGPENYGVFAEKDIKAETVVCVYSGEMFFASQLPFWTQSRNSRVKLGFVQSDEVILSPERRANVGRFLNHDNQDNANVRATWVIAETQKDFELVLILISNRDITVGEELRWCYGIDYVQDHLKCTEKSKQAKKGGKERNQRRN